VGHSVEDLERQLKAAERRVAELQAWADSSDAEAEQLRARVAELEAQPSAPKNDKPDPRLAELQAWADAAEAEAEQLRARVAELEKHPPAAPKSDKPDPRLAELQAWADAAEAEADQLRARVAELEAQKTAASDKPDPRLAELQAWVDSSEEEADQLRARVAELEAQKTVASDKPDPRLAELQAWVDAAEAEADKLRTRVAELEGKHYEAQLAEMRAWVDSSEAEADQLRAKLAEAEAAAGQTRTLVERVSELESMNHSLRELNSRFAGQVDAATRRDIEALERQLEQARASGIGEKVVELESSLAVAREAIATLEVERSTAVEQVRRYVEVDSQAARKLKAAEVDAQRAELAERDHRIAGLEAQLAEKVDESSVLQVRLKAYVAEEARLQNDLSHLRQRACTAEEKLGALQSEREALLNDKSTLSARSDELARKLDESQRWLAQSELDTAELERQLEAARTERALRDGSEGLTPAGRTQPPPPPKDATEPEGDDLEGFSVQRLHRLEALLAAEKIKSESLGRFVTTVEHSLARMQEELDAARGRLADLKAKLGLSDDETGEALDRLDATRRELHALKAELSRAHDLGPADEEVLDDAEVMEAPLDALEALSAQQDAATREATAALAGEQRAREQLVGDLTWLKNELEKLSHVRDELRQRVQAMVQRELQRKQVVGALLQKLRSTEVSAAARAGSLRRLQAAMELAQRTAVRVQTIYFQKQIGSLQRQLEVLLNVRKSAPLKVVR
jgi:chromosome segregation ATPase